MEKLSKRKQLEGILSPGWAEMCVHTHGHMFRLCSQKELRGILPTQLVACLSPPPKSLSIFKWHLLREAFPDLFLLHISPLAPSSALPDLYSSWSFPDFESCIYSFNFCLYLEYKLCGGRIFIYFGHC